MKPISILMSIIAVAVSAHAASVPEAPTYQTQHIPGLPGPEDFAIDYSLDVSRILISSDERLDPDGRGEIYELIVAPDTPAELNPPSVLPRFNEPVDISFRPHGVAISKTLEGMVLLWVITHRSTGVGPPHAILKYEVRKEGLYYLSSLEDPLLVSPNDLFVTDDGRVYVSNDSSGDGGFAETAFSMKKSSVVMYDGIGSWSIVAKDLAFANGIYVDGNTAYVAATRQNAVFAYDIRVDGTLSNRRILARIKGPDNLMPDGDNLIVAAHTRTLALVRHMGNQDKPSPSVVYRVDTHTGDTAVVFSDEGTLISAASTAAFIGGDLYVGQIVGQGVVRAKAE